VLVLHAAATWALVGLIWTIQVVHYPLFDAAAGMDYARFQRRHMQRITFLVGPLMVVEALASVGLLVAATRGQVPLVLALLGLVLLVAIWASTAFVQAPLHGRLEARYDAALHGRLVATNWVRTISWTLRGVLAALMLTLA
jgi:hypothetical protein